METSFKDLTAEDKSNFAIEYDTNKDGESMASIQARLAFKYNVSTRTIRNWAKKLGLNTLLGNEDNFKVLVYDLETCRVPAMVFWTGKTYINHSQLQEEPKIITVSWKWLGDAKVHSLAWDSKHSDETLMRKFLQVYNKADMVIGYNNDKFDNKWVNARAAKYKLDVNLHIKSFDVMKQAKKLFRIPSYSMAYLSKYLGVTIKQSHEGIKMWDMIQMGNEEQQAEYLQKMIDYNVGDIVSTEELYLVMRRYMGHKTNLGVFKGVGKHACPNCGGTDVREYNGNLSITPAGTIQRHMICKKDQVQFKISNTTFLKYYGEQNK